MLYQYQQVEISTPLLTFSLLDSRGKYRIHSKKKLSRQAVLFPYFKLINPIILLQLAL